MLPNPAKHLLGLVALLLVGAFVYAGGDAALGSVNSPSELHDAMWGAVFEWRTGDLLGFLMLFGVALAGVLGLVALLATRDGDLPPDPEVEVPLTSPAIWPLVSALGMGVMVVGLITNAGLFVLGALVLGVAALEWAVTSWTDRYSDDPAANHALRNKLMLPLEVPVFATALIGVPVVMVSRIFLASSKSGAAIVAIVVSVVVLGGAFAIYLKPTLSRNLVAGASALALAAVIVGGIVSVAVGEREFEIHVGGHGEEHGDEGDESDSEESLGSDGSVGEAVEVGN